MKTTKKIISLLLAVLMAFSMVTVSFTAFAAKKKVTKVAISKTKVTLYTNQKLTLTAKVSPSNASNKKVTWSTSNKKVATVSSKGVVTPKAAGKATITVKAADGSGKKATCAVTVKKFVKVSSVKLNSTSKTLNVGSSVTLKATVSPSGATNKTLKWTTGNKKVATVSSKGVVKGIKAGTATITCAATDGSGKKATCKITVKNVPVSSIKLNKTSISVYPGKTYTLKATVSPSNATNPAVKWTTSDSTAATVDSKGVVRGVKAGKTATITCTAADGSGKKATCKVTVATLAKGISVTSDTSLWYVGKTGKLTAVFNPTNTTNKKVTWTSSEPECVTVDSSGNVTVKASQKTVTRKVGIITYKDTVNVKEAVITAATADGSNLKATYTVNIGKFVALKTLAVDDKLPSEIYVSQSVNLGVKFNPADASEKALTYSTSNKNIATVDSNGNVKAIKEGTVTITVKSVYAPTVTAAKTFTVKPIEATLSIPAQKNFYAVGDTASLIFFTDPIMSAEELGVHFESSDKNVVEIKTVGEKQKIVSIEVKFTGAGKATIGAYTADGKVFGTPVNVEVRELRAEKDYFEKVKGGNIIPLDIYLFNGEKLSSTQPNASIEYYVLGTNGDYLEVDGEGNSYTVSIKKELPKEGAYISFRASNYTGGILEKTVFFVPGEYSMPGQAELFSKFKTYSGAVKANLIGASCTRTIEYSDTVVDNSKSKTDMTVTVGFIPLTLTDFLKEYGSASDSEETDDLLGEMTPESMVNQLFTGKQEEMHYIDKTLYPVAPTVSESEIKRITAVDNGSTYDIRLELNDMSNTLALDAVASSAYGKTMKVIDKAYMNEYKNNLAIAEDDEIGPVDTSLDYGTITQKYSGGYVVLTVDKITDKVIESEYHYKTNMKIDKAIFNLSATISLDDSDSSLFDNLTKVTLSAKLTAYFTMNVENTMKYTSIAY